MTIECIQAFGGGVTFLWNGGECWAPSVEAAQRFVRRMNRVAR